MAELKVYHHELRHNEYEEFYLKYEADKVIAELKEHNVNYRFDNNNMLHKIMKQDAEIRHHKYKRCLAMADYSMYHHFRMLEIYGKRLDNDRAVFKINFGLKWLHRWLKLAEKLKPDNSTAQ